MTTNNYNNPPTKNKRVQDFLEKFFNGKNGSLPKYLYYFPVFLWLSAGVVLLRSSKQNPLKLASSSLINFEADDALHQVGTALSEKLQKDINFISEKVEKTKVFEMSKEEMIDQNKRENFLLEKGKRKLEKNIASQSTGSFDYKKIYFDSSMNDIQLIDSSLSHPSNINLATNEQLNYKMDRYKYEEQLEEQKRQNILQQVVEQNRNRRLEVENSDLYNSGAVAAAYQQGFQNYHNQQTTYNEGFEQADKKKANKPKLSFQTASGLRNQLNLADNSSVKKIETPEKENLQSPVSNQINSPLNNPEKAILGVIDQGQKIRSGDKVQIRVIRNSYYFLNGQNSSNYIFIPKNTLLYGVSSLGSSRLKINITSIRIPSISNEVYATNLKVYDKDGLEGIYIDGTYKQFSKELINQALRSASQVGLNSQLGRLSLRLGRKANRNTKVTIPAGYEVLLF